MTKEGPQTDLCTDQTAWISLSLSDPPYIWHLRAMGMFQRCVVFIVSLTFLPFMSTD